MQTRTRLAIGIGALSALLGSRWAITLEAERLGATGSSTWLPAVGQSPVVTIAVYDGVVGLLGFVVSPVLVFVAGAYFGRGIDLRSEYGGVIRSLALAGLLGYGVARLAVVVLQLGGGLPVTAILATVLPATVVGGLRTALVGFAGVALEHLRSGPRATDRDAAGSSDQVDSSVGIQRP
ncbi:MAG: hypothetical protein ABEJ76_05345 [Halanaeroarchaeum sp.]